MAEAMTRATRQSNLPAAFHLGTTQFTPVPPMARWIFRGDEAAQVKAGHALGIRFPGTLRAEASNALSILWQGPDEFLILAPLADQGRVFSQIETACADAAYALVDVSHRNVGFTLEGPDVETLLASAIQIDLSLPRFPLGMTTRTLLAKADVTLWRQTPQRFHIDLWRSFVPYAVDLLRVAARGL